MVLADSRKASPTPRYSGYYPDIKTYAYGTITLYGITFQKASASFVYRYGSPTTPLLP